MCKLLLTVTSEDRGNCRAYVRDQFNRRFVILDQGHLAARYGCQFELHTCCGGSEPDCPVHHNWEIVQGRGITFITGLQKA